ncbi:metalloregulator ArsR/SmtB family transcription factor [soil metagenome]
MKDQLESERCARYMKALSEGERLKIIETLLEGPRSVSEVAEAMRSPLQNVSHHLRCLAVAGLLNSRREGKFIYYTLNAAILRKATPANPTPALEFGCCRIELGGRSKRRLAPAGKTR